MADERSGLSSAGEARLASLEDRVRALEIHGQFKPDTDESHRAAILAAQDERAAAAAGLDVQTPVSQVDVDALQGQVRELLARLDQQQRQADQVREVDTAAVGAAFARPDVPPPAPPSSFPDQTPMVPRPGPTA